MRIKSVVLSCSLALALCSSAHSEEEASLWPIKDYTGGLEKREALLGDLGGVRTDAADSGVTLDVDQVSTFQSVLDGGRDTVSEYKGTADLELHLDFDKMGLWPGAFVRVKGEGIFGDGVTLDAGVALTPNTDSVLPLPGEDTFNVTEVSFIQFLSEQFGIVLGKLTTLEGDLNDFAHGSGKTQFLNQNLVFNPVTLWTIPYSALGAGIIVVPTEDSVLTVTAIDSEGSPSTSGFNTIDEGGTSLVAEFRTAMELFGQPGHQTIGASWSDRVRVSLDQSPYFFLPRLVDDEPGEVLEREDGSWSVWYNFDHYLVGDPEGGGWGFFGRAGLSDGDPNPAEWFLSAGIGGSGLLPGREQDHFGLGFFYLGLSEELPDTRADLLDDSMGGEVFYNIFVTPWLQVTPDLQIIEPGLQSLDTVYIAGLRARTEF